MAIAISVLMVHLTLDGMVTRSGFLIDITKSSITLNVDGCDVYLPWSVIGQYSYPQWFRSNNDNCIVTAEGYSAQSGKDCLVVNTQQGHFTTAFNYATNTLDVQRKDALQGRDLSDTWEAPSNCRVALITREYTGSITINAASTLGKKTRVIQVKSCHSCDLYVRECWLVGTGASILL